MTDFDSTRITLLEKIKDQHNEQYWEEFVLFYQDFIYAIVRKCGIEPEESKDLTQKVLLKVWKSLPGFEYDKSKGGFRYWLYRISRNVVNSHLKKVYNNSDKLARFLQENSFLKHNEGAPEINQLVDREWEEHIVNLALDNLKKSMSESVVDVFLLSYEGKSQEEIAEITGIAESCIPVYKCRVKQKLQAEITALRNILE